MFKSFRRKESAELARARKQWEDACAHASTLKPGHKNYLHAVDRENCAAARYILLKKER